MFEAAQKVAKMSPAEIVDRFSKIVSVRRQRRLARSPISAESMLEQSIKLQSLSLGDNPDIRQELLEHLRVRTRPRHFFSPDERDCQRKLYRETFPGELRGFLRRVDRFLEGRYSFLGIDLHLESPIRWNEDPLTGREWPRKFFADLDVVGADVPGDVKHVWELNRHQHFVDLGKAYWLTGEEEYAEAFFSQVSGWIDDNPYLYGVNWQSGLEVAMRIISWTWAYFACLHSPALSTNLNTKIIANLRQHAEYLSRNLSFFSSPYNHLVGEAAALFLFSFLFSEIREAPHWQRKAWDILESEVEKQFHSDGFTVEQATSYHHYTLGFYLMCITLRRLNGVDTAERMLSRIRTALRISMHMTRPDGRSPRIGDNDDAKSVVFTKTTHWDFRPLLSLGAALFEDGEMKYVAGGYHEECLWLLGPDSLEKYRAIPAHKPDRCTVSFFESGYFVMRDTWDSMANYLLLDCGPQSHGLFEDSTTSTAHGHADCLSLELCFNGRPLFEDPGMFTYFGDPKEKDHYRGTAAHNTASIDGAHQAQLRPRLNWSHTYRHEIECTLSTNRFDYVRGSYRMARQSNGVVSHRRAVVFVKPDNFLIFDEIDGRGCHEIALNFQVAGGEANLGNGRATSILSVDDEARAQIVCKRLRSDQITDVPPELLPSSIAEGYGTRLSASRLLFKVHDELPLRMVTVVSARVDNAGFDVRIHCAPYTEGLVSGQYVIDIASRGTKDRVFLNIKNRRPLVFRCRSYPGEVTIETVASEETNQERGIALV